MIGIIVLLVVAIVLLIHMRAKLIVWTAVLAFFLGLRMFESGVFDGNGWWIVWLVFLVVAAVVNVPGLRRSILMKPVFKLFRRMLPPISKTEQEALEAGTVWWDGELFKGDPDWDKLFATPKPKLTDQEQRFLDNQVEELCRILDDYTIAKDHDLSPEAWRFIREEGFFGMIIPKVWRTRFFNIGPLPGCDENCQPQHTRWSNSDGSEFTRPCGTAAPLWNRRAEKTLSSPPGPRGGDPLSRPDRTGGGKRRSLHPGLRCCLPREFQR